MCSSGTGLVFHSSVHVQLGDRAGLAQGCVCTLGIWLAWHRVCVCSSGIGLALHRGVCLQCGDEAGFAHVVCVQPWGKAGLTWGLYVLLRDMACTQRSAFATWEQGWPCAGA